MIAIQNSSQMPSRKPTFEDPLTEAITGALRDTGYHQLLGLQVRVDGHEVILRGRLPTYYLKQIAHQAVSQVPGVNVILDNIDVVS